MRLNACVNRVDVETVVVGAGHAGVAASWALAERELEHVVLEEGGVGQTWRSERWDSFRLNTPRWMSRMPGQSVAGAKADGFDTAAEFAASLEEYVRLRALPVREHTGRVRVEQNPDGGFVIRAADEDVVARNVILATGFQRVPVRPPLAETVSPRLLQLDTATYRSPEAVADGAVLVVGGGQSGCQIAEDLAAAGRRVLLSTSRVGWVPRRYRGRDTLGWWTVTGFYEVRRGDVDEAALRVRQPLLSGTEDGHSLSLQSLARMGVELLGRLEGGRDEELRFGDDVVAHVRYADESAAAVLRAIDEHIERSGIQADPAVPDAAAAPFPRLGNDALRALRLDKVGISTVIWSTGMRPRLDAVAIPGLVGNDAVAHIDGVTRIPGLYLLGVPWLRLRKSGIIWGAPADAQATADSIAARRRPPRAPH